MTLAKGNLRPMMLRIVALSFWFSVTCDAQNARDVARKAFGSVVLLATQDANGQPHGIASGFFVRANVIATSAHAIEGSASAYIKIIGHAERHKVVGVVGFDDTHDLALLSVAPTEHTVLSLADNDTAQVGDEIFVVGNPQGLEGTVSQGIVSGVRTIQGQSLLQITAPISPGSSGGPVLNRAAEVVGVATATFQGGQNLNFAIPSKYLGTSLANLSEAVPLDRRKSTRGSSSILSGIGDRNTEGVVAEAFSWDSGFLGSSYSFTLRNRLKQFVSDIHCLVVFVGQTGAPVDFAVVNYKESIPPGLGKRVTANDKMIEGEGKFRDYTISLPLGVDRSVQRLTKTVRFRILDFQIAR